MDGSKAHGGQEPSPDVPTPPTTRRPLPGGRPGAPRVAALDALLREIDGIRSSLETDLTLAAGAVEAGAPGLAASLLSGDRSDLAAFQDRALGHLAALEAAVEAAAAPAPAPAPASAAATAAAAV
ncbi:MAG: hypothetical protein JWN17_3229, partial [Frankiales bacterium]|nr:hypothetical protein [Frankiales bacterium]